MIVSGFHGTNSKSAERIMQDGFQMSRNAYDWLGDGVYFFQDAPQRAWQWAVERYGNSAAMIGATIHLVDCIDLLDVGWYSVMSDTYNSYLRSHRNSGRTLPEQTTGAHRLDREVLNYTIGVLSEHGIKISCVRAAFSEGRPVYPNSAIYDRSHVQIAVRDIKKCIGETWLQDSMP